MLPLWPLEVPDPNDPLAPPHEVMKRATATSQEAKHLLNFIQFAATELGWHASAFTTANRSFTGDRQHLTEMTVYGRYLRRSV